MTSDFEWVDCALEVTTTMTVYVEKTVSKQKKR